MTKKRKKSEVRREQLLDAGLDVFSEKGYHAGSIREIARRAGVTEGLIYHYFDDKRDLLAGIVENMMKKRDQIIGLVRFDLGLAENMKALGDAISSFAVGNPEVMKFIRMIFSIAHTNDEESKAIIAGQIESGISLLGGAIDLKLKQAGQEDINGYLAARFFGGSMIAFLILQYIWGLDKLHPIDASEFINQSRHIFLNGVMPREEKSDD